MPVTICTIEHGGAAGEARKISPTSGFKAPLGNLAQTELPLKGAPRQIDHLCLLQWNFLGLDGYHPSVWRLLPWLVRRRSTEDRDGHSYGESRLRMENQSSINRTGLGGSEGWMYLVAKRRDWCK